MDKLGSLSRLSKQRSYLKQSFFILLLCVLNAYQAYAAPTQTIATSTTNKSEEVSRIVLGILTYTKWQPPETHIELCIVGATRFANLLNNVVLPDSGLTLNVTKQNNDLAVLTTQCDVIYFGDIAPIQQQKVLNVRQNRSILTISELNSECELGSIFCLDTESSPISFKVNLDALAQSGVHINPNVLLLGRKKKVSP